MFLCTLVLVWFVISINSNFGQVYECGTNPSRAQIRNGTTFDFGNPICGDIPSIECDDSFGSYGDFIDYYQCKSGFSENCLCVEESISNEVVFLIDGTGYNELSDQTNNDLWNNIITYFPTFYIQQVAHFQLLNIFNYNYDSSDDSDDSEDSEDSDDETNINNNIPTISRRHLIYNFHIFGEDTLYEFQYTYEKALNVSSDVAIDINDIESIVPWNNVNTMPTELKEARINNRVNLCNAYLNALNIFGNNRVSIAKTVIFLLFKVPDIYQCGDIIPGFEDAIRDVNHFFIMYGSKLGNDDSVTNVFNKEDNIGRYLCMWQVANITGNGIVIPLFIPNIVDQALFRPWLERVSDFSCANGFAGDLPSKEPTAIPSSMPTNNPSVNPTPRPTRLPSKTPSVSPSSDPSEIPTELPTKSPTEMPTDPPSSDPTENPSENPTEAPTRIPTTLPTDAPTRDAVLATSPPSVAAPPSTTWWANLFPQYYPTPRPTPKPTKSKSWWWWHAHSSSDDSDEETTLHPTNGPTKKPTKRPTKRPTKAPNVITWWR